MSLVSPLFCQMMSLKQELERAEERIELVEYRSAERASEIEEALDAHVTRVRRAAVSVSNPCRPQLRCWEKLLFLLV